MAAPAARPITTALLAVTKPLAGVIVPREAVVRVEDRTLARQVGCHPRDCGVALAFDPETAVSAASESRLAAAVA